MASVRDIFGKLFGGQAASSPPAERPIPWTSVSSSNVAAISWEGSKLFVRFLAKRGGKGAIYEYQGVPRRVAEAMLAAGSVGGFVWSDLRGKYYYRRIA